MHYLLEDKIIVKQDNGLYAITNLGAILFAKRISSFSSIARKSVRVIQYKGANRINTIREDVGTKGYANGFANLLKYIEGLLPAQEKIEGAFRTDISVYPSLAIRELVANALIHQDLSIAGAGPTIEIFNNRIEITNPGAPLIDAVRFVDNPPRSRNEALASLMRRAHICEERGSGWDKAVLYCEIHQLPSPKIDIYDSSTKVTMFSYIPFNKIPVKEKKWSCYMHACLKQVSGEQMTNTSLRNRFGLPEANKAIISRLISSALADKLIKPLDPETAPRYMCYVPFWA
jgi:predicted HTH transcriptional regulator